MTQLLRSSSIKTLIWILLLLSIVIGFIVYQKDLKSGFMRYIYVNSQDILKVSTAVEDLQRAKDSRDGEFKEFDFQRAMDKLNEEQVAHDDPRLIKIIRDHYIIPPSLHPYNLEKPKIKDFSRDRFSTMIHTKHLQNKKEGFFIEAGAFDGEFISNTLYFERELNWRGLLIEADPEPFERLKAKHRNAYIMNACISTKPFPSVMKYSSLSAFGRVVDNEAAEKYTNYLSKKMPYKPIQVQCFPLYSILLALGQLTVDFFSLDVNGSELDLLKTVPYENMNLSLILLEFSHVPGGRKRVTNFLEDNGYTLLGTYKEDILVKNRQK